MYSCSDDIARHFLKNLRQARTVCSNHCFLFATTWAAELIQGCHSTLLSNDRNTTITVHDYDNLPTMTPFEKLLHQQVKLSIEQRDFESARAVLSRYDLKHPTLKFLKLYTVYMIGEKAKVKCKEDILGADEDEKAENPHLEQLEDELLGPKYKRKDKEKEIIDSLDAFSLHLYSIILKRQNYIGKASHVLLKSLHAFPYNWSVWLEFCDFIKSRQLFVELKERLDQEFPSPQQQQQQQQNDDCENGRDDCAYIMKNLFLAELCTHIPYVDDVSNKPLFVEIMQSLTRYFPNSAFILGLWGKYFYHRKHYREALIVFEALHAKHPARLQDMDIYSNILYTLQAPDKLCQLDINCSRINAFHPISFVVKGNYCSFKKQNHDAVAWYKKALRLQHNYAEAWILLGHTYLDHDVKTGALECYRRALAIKPYDHRPIHGSGEVYRRMIGKNDYLEAIYCFQQAIDMYPDDIRSWRSLQECYRMAIDMNIGIDMDMSWLADSPSSDPHEKNEEWAQMCGEKIEVLRKQKNINDKVEKTMSVLLAQLLWDIGNEERAVELFTSVWTGWHRLAGAEEVLEENVFETEQSDVPVEIEETIPNSQKYVRDSQQDIPMTQMTAKELRGHIPEQLGYVAVFLAEYAIRQHDYAEARRFATSALKAGYPYDVQAQGLLTELQLKD